MIKGKYGIYDGNSWEERCQECLKLKYEKDGYQELPASQGDIGIEGFTRTGIVFQCYCPDEEYDPIVWYEKQRDKVTKDLRKLTEESYILKIKEYLKDIKIKEWIFLTPIIKRKELIKHCHDKEIEYREKKLDHFDENLRVLAEDESFLMREFEQLLGSTNKLSITPNVNDEDIYDWQSKNNELIERATRKNKNRIDISKPGINTKINILTETTIRDYLDMNNVLFKLKELSPNRYEKLQEIINRIERQVSSMCATNQGSNVILLDNIKVLLKNKITMNFSDLSEDTCDQIANGIIAQWIFRCPIEFEYI